MTTIKKALDCSAKQWFRRWDQGAPGSVAEMKTSDHVMSIHPYILGVENDYK
jgi:hypothetical protein